MPLERELNTNMRILSEQNVGTFVSAKILKNVLLAKVDVKEKRLVSLT
jgi:hypothetical protein